MYCDICGKWSGDYPRCKECYYDHKNENKEEKKDLGNKAELICPICGSPTRVYMGKARKDRLCPKHADMLKEGSIEQTENGDFIDAKTKESMTQTQNSEPQNESDTKEISNQLTCILCGQNSCGQHFCHSCYYKNKNKVLYIQVKNCKDFVKLEAEYESEFTCEDGHMVKSPFEKIIDNWLYLEGIKHAYEKKLSISKDKDITPDFYIPELKDDDGNIKKDIYIEFWGYDETNVKYQQAKQYKMSLYPELCKKKGITLVYLNKKDVENDYFKKKIKYADPGIVNE